MGWRHILLLFSIHLCLHPSLLLLLLASPFCPPHQRDALLLFKHSFLLDSTTFPYYYCEYDDTGVTSYSKTNSWDKGVDCCSWDGVTCDDLTGNVIALDLTCNRLRGTLTSNTSLLLLRHLQSLNLSRNNFVGSPILSNLSAFTELTHLNLSHSYFGGVVPNEISHLSKLVSLDLSRNYYFYDTYLLSPLKLENPVFSLLVQNLTALRKVALDYVDMSMVSPKSFANLSSSLTYLSLESCSLAGTFPDTVFRSPSLTTLDVSYNRNLSGILPKSNWTSPLEILSLLSTNFSGEIPHSIGNLKSLTVLDFYECKFTRQIPSSLADLQQLQELYIRGNNFSKPVEFEIFARLKNLRTLFVSQELNLIYNTSNDTFPKLEVLWLPFCNLTKFPYFLKSLNRLTSLGLAYNRISGEIPSWFWGISHDSLERLSLSSNHLEGGIQEFPWKRLQYIYLSNNSFHGPLPVPPPSIVNFVASNNGFTGEISSYFGNTTNFRYLHLSGNKLQGSLPRSLVKCVNLSTLVLANNEFSDIFPHWLEAPQLWQLDLQSNKFHGRINLTTLELSFPSLEVLSISNNSFDGQLPMEFFSNTSLLIIDLSNNKFEGPIPLPTPITFYYAIASNEMAGKIPSLICNFTMLEIIDLSNNSLTGVLPWCLTNFSTELSILNLRMNYLEGTIPQYFSSRSSLRTLDLSRNRFEGILPQSLVKCRYLEVLDLNDNRIESTFPRWLGMLPELKILILSFNNLKGLLDIPSGAHLFPKLHILDLSNNNLCGPLPIDLIMSLRAIVNGEDVKDKSLYMTRYLGENTSSSRQLYDNSVTLTMKGQQIWLVKIFTFLTVIDLSHNSFQGNVPEVVGHLHSLIGLNLSHNHFTGSIPSSLGNLTNLGWLDLSSNKLDGIIPRELGALASLGYLNLSKNQLIGRIPQDKQLSTFSSDSFSGNQGLCGTPLPKACPGDAQPPPPPSSSTFNHEGHESWFKQKTMWIGYASGIIIGMSISYIAFETETPKCLTRRVRMLEGRITKWMEKPKRKAIKFLGQ